MRTIVISILSIGILVGDGAAQAAQKPQIGSAVTVVNQVVAEYEQDRRDLHAGDRVHEDELIEVGGDSKGEVVLDDETMLALGPGSRLLLDKFIYNGERSKGDIVLNLVKGTFRFITGAATKPSYKITTPVASITVRGTIFDLYIADNGLWLLLIEGAVRACNEAGVCRNLTRPGQILHINAQGVIGQPTRWASLPRSQAVPFDTAFPFVVTAPTIDPVPLLTRAAIEGGSAPRPPRKSPPSEQGSGKKQTSKPERRRQETAQKEPGSPGLQGLPIGLSIGIGVGGIGRGGGGRHRPPPSYPTPNRDTGGKF